MANQYYTASGNPAPLSRASSAVSRNESLLIQQAFDKLPNPSDVAGGQSNFYNDTGTPGNLVIATLDPNVSDLTDGLELVIRVSNASIGATTILAGGFPIKQVRSFDGTQIGANDFVAGQFISVRYDAVNGWFQYDANSTTAAQAAAAAAAASAQTALNAPGTSATSTTSDTIATGSTTITVQPGKAFVVGMSVKQAITVSPTNWNYGDITAYDPVTGVMTINVTLTQGLGTSSGWTVSLSGPTLQTGISSGVNYGPASADVVLTSASPNVQGITPQVNGLAFVLPDATSVVVGSRYDLSNIEDATNSASMMVKDSIGNILGFLPPGVTTTAELMSGATAAGVWSLSNVDWFGTEALGSVTTSTVLSNLVGFTGYTKNVALSATRTLVVMYASSVHALVYDSSTRTFGTPQLLRSSLGLANLSLDKVACLLIGTDKALIVSCDNALAGQAICITISGTVITIGAPIAITVQDSNSKIVDLQAYGASYVASFTSGQRFDIVAMTVTGTVVTSGAFSNIFNGGSGQLYAGCAFAYNASTYLGVYMITTGLSLSSRAATISGTTITMGGAVSITSSATNFLVRRSLPGNCVVAFVNTQVRLVIITVSGTTAAFGTQLNTAVTVPFSISLSNDQTNTNAMVLAVAAASGSVVAFNDIVGVPTLVGSAYAINSISNAVITYVGEISTGHMFSHVDTGGTVLYNFAVGAASFSLSKLYRNAGISTYTSGVLPPDPTAARQVYNLSTFTANSTGPVKTHAIGVLDGSKLGMRISDSSLVPSVRASTVITSMANGSKGATNAESWVVYNRGNTTVEIQKARLV